MNPRTTSLLEQLVANCRSDKIVYTQASVRVSDPVVRGLLSSFAALRLQVADELERSAAQQTAHGVRKAEPNREQVEQASVAGVDPADDPLQRCDNCDQLTLRHYQELLKCDLPPGLRQTISRQFAAVAADHQRLKEALERDGAGPHVRAKDAGRGETSHKTMHPVHPS